MRENRNINPKITVIGGGTGNSVILKGIKTITENIVTIVAMGDNGGSTGKLREDLGMLPPGDIRACLLALSNIEPEMEKILGHRFDKGTLKGQSFGNLFLAALNEIYGSFEEAVAKSANILNITGKVYPMTTTNVNLIAKLNNGKKVYGETQIPEIVKEEEAKIEQIILDPENVKPMPGAIEEIKTADIIVIGPGSLYTSVIPNLLIEGIVAAINQSDAKKVYICNVMTQEGETKGYGVKEHIQALYEHAPLLRIDYVIVNNKEIEEKEILGRYIEENQEPIILKEEDYKYAKEKGIKIIEGEFASEVQYVKHDSIKVAKVLKEIYIENAKTKEFKPKGN